MNKSTLVAGMVIGAMAGGIMTAVIEKKQKDNSLACMGKKMLKKCTSVVSNLM